MYQLGGLFWLWKQAFHHSLPTHTHSPASPVWLGAVHFISTAHHNGGVCVSVLLRIISALLITMEEYVSVHLRVYTNCTPSCSHTSIYRLGHIRHFPSKVSSSLSRWEGVHSESKYGPSFQTNATPLLARTPTHAVTHLVSHTQTRARWNYHLWDVMMRLAV